MEIPNKYKIFYIIIMILSLTISYAGSQTSNREYWIGSAEGNVKECCDGDCQTIPVTASGHGTVAEGVFTGTVEAPAGTLDTSASWGMKKGAKISGRVATAGASVTWTGKRRSDTTASGTWKLSSQSEECSASGKGSWSAKQLFIKIIDAKMVSPDELGIGIQVMYPVGISASRKVRFSAVINGIPVEQTFDLTDRTQPGVLWGGKNDLMFDSKGKLKPTTFLRINLKEKGVPRFSENMIFDLSGVAYFEGGPQSQESRFSVKILLPAVLLHGLLLTDGSPDWFQPLLEMQGYPLAYGTFRSYMKKMGFESRPRDKTYNTKPYRTYFDPIFDPTDNVLIEYTDPKQATPEVIKEDLDIILDNVFECNYASKVNLIGHCFGGLVARYYASERPERVNKVITVGTPHDGATFFYEEMFKKMKNREEVENFLKTPSGEKSILYWTIPTYYCLQGAGPDALFQNTFIAPANPDIKYYSIYCDKFKTSEILIVKPKDGWYTFDKKKGIIYGMGDGFILGRSASDFGTKVPVDLSFHTTLLGLKHGLMFRDKAVQVNIYNILNS
jgi:pimeloyl-ACP methyl ester carboxylesterase